jgi:hypothetical protein
VCSSCDAGGKLELTSDSDDSGSKNAKDTVGDLAVSAFGGSLESGGQFCVRAFGRNLASVAMKMFSRLIYFIKKLYKLCTFSAICK